VDGSQGFADIFEWKSFSVMKQDSKFDRDFVNFLQSVRVKFEKVIEREAVLLLVRVGEIEIS
jgi:hypothetical protein